MAEIFGFCKDIKTYKTFSFFSHTHTHTHNPYQPGLLTFSQLPVAGGRLVNAAPRPGDGVNVYTLLAALSLHDLVAV